MKRLKRIRENMGMSQTSLAEMMKTTQQTIGRWENGKAEPSLAKLRDLAVIFGVSVDFLIGKQSASSDTVYMDLGNDRGDFTSGYWGNVGIRTSGDDHSRWYPVSSRVVSNLEDQINHNTDALGVVRFQTLNNRMVFFRPSEIERTIFLDEACDPVVDDWEVGFADIEGLPLEIYHGLDRHLARILGDDDDDGEESEHFAELIDNLIKEHDLDEDALREILETTNIRMVSGKTFSYDVDPIDVVKLNAKIEVYDGAMSEAPAFTLNAYDGALDAVYHWNKVAMIDTPLIPFLKESNRHLMSVGEELEELG
jgi:DNA-binding XRE family transcriptional regulator